MRVRGRALVAAVVLCLSSCAMSGDQHHVLSVSAEVVRVVDGDTVEVKSNEESQIVRVLGIDAPEAGDCGSGEATERLAQLLPPGSAVAVVGDPVSDSHDRYGRALAYLETEGTGDLGLLLVDEGLVGVWWPRNEPTPARAALYEEHRDLARDALVGSWAVCGELGRA